MPYIFHYNVANTTEVSDKLKLTYISRNQIRWHQVVYARHESRKLISPNGRHGIYFMLWVVRVLSRLQGHSSWKNVIKSKAPRHLVGHNTHTEFRFLPNNNRNRCSGKVA